MNLNLYFVVGTLFGLILWLVAPVDDRRTERRFFWCGFVIATASAFFIPRPPDWTTSSILSVFVAGVMIFNAYFLGSNIKIRGKIFAYHVDDSLPDPSPDGTPAPGTDDPEYDPAPDSYGGLATARKSWWLHIVAVAICVLCVIIRSDDKPGWMAPVMAACLIAMALVLGYLADGSWGYPIARGQHLQFGIIALITAGVFPVFYLPAYYAGRRWPLRRKQSMEYRVHPHHWKKEQ